MVTRRILSHFLTTRRRSPQTMDLPPSPRLLVVALEHQLGAIMAVTPMLGALRAAQPHAHITVLGVPLMAETIRHCPHINAIVALPDPHDRPLTALLAALWRSLTTAQPYDAVIATPVCRRRIAALMALAQPADRVVGFAPPSYARFVDHRVNYDEHSSVITNGLLAVAPFGGEPCSRPPEAYFDVAAARRVREWLADGGLHPDCPIAAYVTETSGGQPTHWAPERMAEVAITLQKHHGLQPVFVGTEAGAEPIAAIQRHMDGAGLSLAGRTSVPDLAALFALSDLAIAVDTGAMHVARGVSVPLVVVASAWQERHHWLPLNERTCRVVSRHDLACAGCLQPTCSHHDCMTGLTPSRVLDAADSLLAAFPPGSAGRARRMRERMVASGG